MIVLLRHLYLVFKEKQAPHLLGSTLQAQTIDDWTELVFVCDFFAKCATARYRLIWPIMIHGGQIGNDNQQPERERERGCWPRRENRRELDMELVDNNTRVVVWRSAKLRTKLHLAACFAVSQKSGCKSEQTTCRRRWLD